MTIYFSKVPLYIFNLFSFYLLCILQVICLFLFKIFIIPLQLVTLESHKTLEELKLYPKETLTLEERWIHLCMYLLVLYLEKACGYSVAMNCRTSVTPVIPTRQITARFSLHLLQIFNKTTNKIFKVYKFSDGSHVVQWKGKR